MDEIRKINIWKDVYFNPEDHKKYLDQIRINGFIKEYELHLKKKDGSELFVIENSTAIFDNNKNIIAFRGIFRDVTEKKKLEEQIRRTEKMESMGQLAGGIAHDFNNILAVLYW